MKAKPYVGVTGPVTNQEVQDICKEFSEAGYSMNSINPQHIPMLGFLASYKTLTNQPTINRRYPPVRQLPDLLAQSDKRVLNMIHYNSREEDLVEQVSCLFDGIYDRGLCQAIQLNVVWPGISQVKKIKEIFPEMQVVFQASHSVMEGKTPADIANGIKDYGESINYVLIDPSGGRGLPFDLESSLAIYNEIRCKTPDLTIGFAGGFTGENVAERLGKIISKTGETGFCIDAEGGLRDKISDAYGDDLLNIQKVKDYLQAASGVSRTLC